MGIQPYELQEIYEKTQTKRPLIYQITNRVSAQVQADVVALLGGFSIMTTAKQEITETTQKSDALLINIGTPDEMALAHFSLAMRAAEEKNIPTVLDLVGYGFTQYRTVLVNELLARFHFSVIKGNGAEISALAGIGSGPVGVSSREAQNGTPEVVKTLSNRYGAAVFCTGERDFLACGNQYAVTRGGSHHLSRLSGIGCALGSAAALFSVTASPVKAALAALTAFRSASDGAAYGAKGPGSFYRNFQDALALLATQKNEWGQYYETL